MIGDGVREAQAVETRKFIDDQNIPAAEPVIITGDFNIDFYIQVGIYASYKINIYCLSKVSWANLFYRC